MARAVRLVLGPHAFIQYEIPEDADFQKICGEIKSWGHYFNGVDTFIPYGKIEAILLITSDEAVKPQPYTGVLN